MGKMSSPRLCVFCGQAAGNKEHIVGKWLRNDLGLYSAKSKIGIALQHPTGGTDDLIEPQPLGSFVTESVFEKCNNGWISLSVKEVKALLSPRRRDGQRTELSIIPI
jgi:hypothetical protein